MFGIGFSEIFIILLVVLLLFGADKVPEFARGLAKTIAQVKNATNEIKSEITKNVNEQKVVQDIKENFSGEQLKKRLGYDDLKESMEQDTFNPVKNVQQEIEQAKEDIENLTGPIKRMK